MDFLGCLVYFGGLLGGLGRQEDEVETLANLGESLRSGGGHSSGLETKIPKGNIQIMPSQEC